MKHSYLVLKIFNYVYDTGFKFSFHIRHYTDSNT